MTNMLDWNDLRYFLAVARDGSTLAAGRALRVSQTTVARRIAALEEAVGLTLFEKRPAGYALTAAGDELLDHAEAVEAAALKFDSAAGASTRDVSGTVRLTAEEIFSVTLFAPLLRELHDLHPGIVIELDSGQALRDLGAGEADIALRSTVGDQAAGLVGRQIALTMGRCTEAAITPTARSSKKSRGASRPRADWRRGWQYLAHYESWLTQLGLEDRVG